MVACFLVVNEAFGRELWETFLMFQLTCSQLELASPIILASSALNILGLPQVRNFKPRRNDVADHLKRVSLANRPGDFGNSILLFFFVS